MTLDEELQQYKEKLVQCKKTMESNERKMDCLIKENTSLKNKMWNIENIELGNLRVENKTLKEKQTYIEQKHNQRLKALREHYEAEVVKARRIVKHEEILNCLSRNNGNIIKAAFELGISRQALYQRLNRANGLKKTR
ncbi:hypothetical protein JCM17380_13310 [Desulfosporosinus burensis]